MPKGGARHFAKPYVEPSILLQVLEKHLSLVKDLGPYELASRNAAINPEGIVKCRHLLNELVEAAPCAEVHTSSLRNSLMSLLSKKPEVNGSTFNGSTWANTKTERFCTLLCHLRKLAREEKTLCQCAAKLSGKDFDRLQKLVAKVQVEEEPLKKEPTIDVDLDEKGFPKMLESPTGSKKRGRSSVRSPLEKKAKSCVGGPLKKRERVVLGALWKKSQRVVLGAL